MNKKLFGIVGVGAAVGVLALVLVNSGCTSVGGAEPERGSHGFRVWSGDSLVSFTHRGQDICVPEGWQAVAPTEEGEGTARFERGKTGVIIRKDAFGLRTLEPLTSSYRVTVLYPLTLPRGEVESLMRIVAGAFSGVGELYGDRVTGERTPHTVVVTAGLDQAEHVYPDPHARVTYMIASPKAERGEGLLIHAVVHLYNRFSGDRPYLAKQWPFNAGEFQELEATWAESALTTHPDGAFKRLMYLYRVHTAVVAQDFSLIEDAPFNDRAAFDAIEPTILVPPGAPYLDVQYGHYVLAPLTMAAIDALLVERGTGVRVYGILKDLHTGKRESFMEALKEVLSDKDVKAVSAWITADAQVPVALIEKAIALYSR